ncbi:MAG: Tetratricopeptide repeat protein [Acidobacteria bacterium OLB17]|nr:MAG: Tetratricopeptide repeat protein [Acidobacteria bacterium OLB17]
MIAEMTVPTDPAARELLASAQRFAPGDPMSFWLASGIERQAFSPESATRSMNLMEEAVKLSPYDYRWWIELGRASEQAGNAERAETAFRHAVELAPTYTIPRCRSGISTSAKER